MRKGRLGAIGLGTGLVLAAVLAVGFGIAQAASGSAKATSPLQKACGGKIVVQTDWFPEPEHGALYQLAGTNGTLDAKRGRYTGQIGKTGVQLEIRSGGPFTGFQQPISQLYQDSSITIGYVTTDEAVQLSKKLPTVAIVAPLEFSPQILMWNPQKLSISRFQDIANSGAKVLVFEGGVWVDYLVSRGWVNKNQVDTSYDGSPTRFVASDGAIVQQGFATSEPYQYLHDIKQWGKPVKYLMIKNSGYVPYPQALAAKPDVVKSKRACFKLLVPLVQKAQVDFLAKPAAVNDKLVQIVDDMKTFWVLTKAGNAWNADQQRKLGLVQNGPNCTLGDFNMKRTQQLINLLKPIYTAKGLDTFDPNLKAAQIVTNEFINPKIGLKSKRCT
ncbi:hypothetical protein Gocc_1323 [Gaiella occulta]|uniref:ABC transporter substrate-binding protein n=1 Tax=Gaiella occulta TaxID=1002870 RepID=A0A7M2YZF4_9ACTN|nr:ABC transporter substrate-binding protein [Gaiella occulta]RDI75525.1 hypothetical protein Gocc_1323 [Gaiella occulta]